jgi:hypothetical protein
MHRRPPIWRCATEGQISASSQIIEMKTCWPVDLQNSMRKVLKVAKLFAAISMIDCQGGRFDNL